VLVFSVFCLNHDFHKIKKINRIFSFSTETQSSQSCTEIIYNHNRIIQKHRHCGLNPQSPDYNALNKEIAGQARNDGGGNNLENPKNLTKIKVQTKSDKPPSFPPKGGGFCPLGQLGNGSGYLHKRYKRASLPPSGGMRGAWVRGGDKRKRK